MLSTTASTAIPDAQTVAVLERLVGFDSTSSKSNLSLVDWIADYLDGAAARCRRWHSPDRDKAGLVVRVGPEIDAPRGGGLVLSGHLDVVPATEDGWLGDPFNLRDAGDRWIGRGSCDMKGFVAAAIETARRSAERPLRAPLFLLLTYDEEVGSVGIQQLLAERGGDLELPRAVVIGEPTSLGIVNRHKGHLRLRVEVRGRAAHSGFPHRGQSAIEPAAEIVLALQRLRQELEVERLPSSRHFPDVPFAALNVGTLRGGSAVNVVPELCELGLGVRLLPGLDVEELETRIRAAIEGASDAEVEVTVERGNLSPPLETADSARLVRTLVELAGSAPEAAAFSSDGGWLSASGHDAVLWGPGSIEVAHRPEEFLPKTELALCARGLDLLVDRFCRGDHA